MTSRIPEKQKVDWDSHIERWRHSGASRSQYARNHNLNYDQFNYRCRKAHLVDERPEQASKEATSNFIQVRVTDEPSQSSTTGSSSVITPDGLKVELGQQWAPRDVVDFLRLWGEPS